MSEKVLDPDFLAEYQREDEWADAHGVHQRTVARYRALGLPYLSFGGQVWIHRRGGREWIASRVKRRNTRRTRQSTTSAPSRSLWLVGSAWPYWGRSQARKSPWRAFWSSRCSNTASKARSNPEAC
jgi:hypothetical protein